MLKDIEMATRGTYKLDNKQRAKIVKLYMEGLHANIIAARFGISRDTVFCILKNNTATYAGVPKNVPLVQKVEMVSVATERKKAHSI